MRRILTLSDMQQQPFGGATKDKCEIDGAAVRKLLRRVLSKACNTCPWYEVRGRGDTKQTRVPESGLPELMPVCPAPPSR